MASVRKRQRGGTAVWRDTVKLANVSHADGLVWVTPLSTTFAVHGTQAAPGVLSLTLDLAVRDGWLARRVAEKTNLPQPSASASLESARDRTVSAGAALRAFNEGSGQ